MPLLRVVSGKFFSNFTFLSKSQAFALDASNLVLIDLESFELIKTIATEGPRFKEMMLAVYPGNCSSNFPHLLMKNKKGKFYFEDP